MKAILSTVNNICAIIFSGYVFSVLWGWFIVTTFGLPVIGVAAALGVILVGTYVSHQFSVPDEKHKDAHKVYKWVKPLFALLIGLIIKLFM